MPNIRNTYLANPQLLAQAGWSAGNGVRYATVQDMMSGGSSSWGHLGFPGGKSAQDLIDVYGNYYVTDFMLFGVAGKAGGQINIQDTGGSSWFAVSSTYPGPIGTVVTKYGIGDKLHSTQRDSKWIVFKWSVYVKAFNFQSSGSDFVEMYPGSTVYFMAATGANTFKHVGTSKL
mgnify:CR=1 FL=1